MSKLILNQITIGATPGDAITDQAFLIRAWLREKGFVSDIYAEHIHPALEKEVYSAIDYQPQRGEKRLILHHSIGSQVVNDLLNLPLELILVYHNITPPKFFFGTNPALAKQMEEGQRQLLALRSQTILALADSAYNEIDLKKAEFAQTGVLSISLDESRYQLPNDAELVAKFKHSGPLLLFVGRLVPNKKQEDLIKLLYYYRRIEPNARLLLVGQKWLPEYVCWLQDFARDLGVENAVLFTDHVSQQEMITYYRIADLYVSMSEHEGFGKPLIESMYLDLPVLAYAAAAVPYTLGNAGVLIHHKNYEALAELVDLLVTDNALRARILASQRKRVQSFMELEIKRQLYNQLNYLLS